MEIGSSMSQTLKWLLLILYPLVAFLFAWSVILAVSTIFTVFGLDPGYIVLDSSIPRGFYVVIVGVMLGIFAPPYWAYIGSSKDFYSPMSLREVFALFVKIGRHTGIAFFWLFLVIHDMSLLFLPVVMVIGIWKGVKDK